MMIDFSKFLFTGRGSTALWLILESLRFKNAKILIPVNVCEIVVPIIEKAGMVPVYYDVQEKTGISNMQNIADSFSGDEKILMVVHNFGIPVEIDSISEWAKNNNIYLIEDVCNALGASFKNIPLGYWGDASIFSFGYAKIIETGFGGAAIINNLELEDNFKILLEKLDYYSDIHNEKNDYFQRKINILRKGDSPDTFSYSSIYNNYANYLLYKLNKKHQETILNELQNLPSNILKRKHNAERYRYEIMTKNATHIDEVEGQVYWRYNLLVDLRSRDDLIEELRKNNVLVSKWYPPIIPLFKGKFEMDKFNGSFTFADKIINLFVDHRINDDDITKTIKIINEF